MVAKTEFSLEMILAENLVVLKVAKLVQMMNYLLDRMKVAMLALMREYQKVEPMEDLLAVLLPEWWVAL